MKKNDEKHKIVAIPVSFIDDKPRFLTVRDRRFKEWIFVTGGCRKSEISNPVRCALRELEEETRGVINLKRCKYSYFKFRVFDQDGTTPLVYHVYIIIFDINRILQRNIIREFYIEKIKMDAKKKNKESIKRTYDENDMINFETLDEFNKKPRWSLIVDNIINNPDFYVSLTSSNYTYF
jgi:hypothetical protein